MNFVPSHGPFALLSAKHYRIVSRDSMAVHGESAII
jgi:hypothetical protein